jgi:sugar diacid utilization regulator
MLFGPEAGEVVHLCSRSPSPERDDSAERRLAAATWARLRRELADDLLDGATDAVSPEDLASRGRALGQAPNRPYRAVVLRWTDTVLDDSFRDAVEAAARALRITCLTTSRDHAVVALAQRLDTEAFADTAVWQTMHDSMTKAFPGGVGSMGIGGLAPTDRAIPRSYRQARQALRIRTNSLEADGVTNHDQLGVYGLVTNSEADDFVQEWLGPLLDYDQQHTTTELTETLAAYLTHTGVYSQTSNALNIHRSTLRYRLHSIRELLQHDLGEPEIRFNLQIATRIWQGSQHNR